MRDGFVFYKSFADAVGELPAEQYKAIMTALCAYALEDVEPENLGAVEKGFFALMRPQIDANNKRYENGKLGGRPKKPNDNQTETKPKPNENQTETKKNQSITEAEPKEKEKDKEKDKVKEKDKDIDKSIYISKEKEKEKEREKETGTKRFVPPTPEEVQAYCNQMGYTIDPERFVSYYASNGWRVGRNPMKDWKAAARNWATRDRPKTQGIQRGTDYDALVLRGLRR